ncbi:MAG: hypothetical protein ACXVMS_07285 [Flavisolibacter sp.]
MRPESIIQQFIFETESWGRWLAFFQQENFYNKMRLADLVSNSSEESVLATAERFQEEFLSQDMVISFLKEELKKQNFLLQQEVQNHQEVFFGEINKNQKAFEKNIKKEEELFGRIKDSFSSYLWSLAASEKPGSSAAYF